MNECLKELKPSILWYHFSEILKIPRCSGEEKAIGNYILKIAEALNLNYKRDEVGNIAVFKPAQPGTRSEKRVILQAHLDMICEKNSEVIHDFSQDPIQVKLEGEWLKAQGTTLGADNGVGVAAALAVMESDNLKHGPLEFLFTVDEETGLTGASHLKPEFIQGKLFLNLDSEEEGTFTIGCAGGGDSEIFYPLNRLESQSGTLIEVKITGLRGGHSGLDIHLGRANAIKILARLLDIARENLPISILHVEGGSKRNAIPREALARLICDAAHYSDVIRLFEREFNLIKKEYRQSEPEAQISIKQIATANEEPLAPKSARGLINLLLALPHGVLAMHQEIPDLVETSSNLAIVKTERHGAKIICNSRSSLPSALKATRSMIRAIAETAGAEISQPPSYPGWEPNLGSPLLQVAKRVYQSIFGQTPLLKAVHAGLECGLIAEKFPDMDMISFGPTIKNPHSPEEMVYVPSVEKFWRFLSAIIEELSLEEVG
ncbi:MAG: aminoacyl-histidine dipeptidase [Candidatus Aminicenantes bacterium]|nr:aminoacyl-histidine dipeptidase [Candidatus Aminicenantes bacterium]